MVKQFRLWGWVAACSVMVILVGCARTKRMPTGESLCDRFGGTASISAVIDQYVTNVAADTRINGRFAITDIRRLKGYVVDQVCMATGAPCIYSVHDMKTIHAGMKISSQDFKALVEDWVKALGTFKVQTQGKGELLGLVGPVKNDLVEDL